MRPQQDAFVTNFGWFTGPGIVMYSLENDIRTYPPHLPSLPSHQAQIQKRPCWSGMDSLQVTVSHWAIKNKPAF